MSNNTKHRAGPQPQPNACRVQEATTNGNPQTTAPPAHKKAAIRRITLPGNDTPGDSLSPSAGKGVFDIAKSLQEIAATAPALPGIVKALQGLTLKDSALCRVQEAAAACISLSAAPAGIKRQIEFLASLKIDAIPGLLPNIAAVFAELVKYYSNSIDKEYYDLFVENTEQQKVIDKQQTQLDLARAVFKAAGLDFDSFVETAPNSLAAVLSNHLAGPQSGLRQPDSLEYQPGTATPPATPQPGRLLQDATIVRDFYPDITSAQINAVYNALPPDFGATPEQIKELFNTPIEMSRPIKTKNCYAAALLYKLQENRLINRTDYAKIADRCNCFENKRGKITAKQLITAKYDILNNSYNNTLKRFAKIDTIKKEDTIKQ